MKLGIVTSSRADFGILSNLIEKIEKDNYFDSELIVTGTHLVKDQGYTINEIKEHNLKVKAKIEIFSEPNTTSGYMAVTLDKFSNFFEKHKYDLILVLGDRFEMLAICLAAVNNGIKIAHLHGGEITLGSLDNYYRNCITMLSTLHFTATKVYYDNVVRMIGSSKYVYNVGSLGVENCKNSKPITKAEIEEKLSLKLSDKYAIATYHPNGLTVESLDDISSFCQVMENHQEIQFIVTKGNNDAFGMKMNKLLEKKCKNLSNVHIYTSLGMKVYFSLVRNAMFVIGNSSSGIIEVPSFKTETINIGNRQEGRCQANSIINCDSDAQSIERAISKVGHLKQKIVNPYEGKNTSNKIICKLKEYGEKL